MRCIAKSVFISQANMEFRQNMIYAGSLATTKRRYISELTANPTLVAIEELQLHDLQSIEADP